MHGIHCDDQYTKRILIHAIKSLNKICAVLYNCRNFLQKIHLRKYMAIGKWASAFHFFGQRQGWAASHSPLPTVPYQFHIAQSSVPSKSPDIAINGNHFTLLSGDKSINGNHFMPLSGDNSMNGNHFIPLFNDNLTNGNHFTLLLGDNTINGNHFMLLSGDNTPKHSAEPLCCTGLHGGTSPPPPQK